MDAYEKIRREMTAKINANPGSRESLEAMHGKVWDTKELQQDFQALSFGAPFIVVNRKVDGVKGTLYFQHSPRFYYDFSPS